ncbi:hypothetical protein D3C87_879130 [compost metagenome]
MTRARTMPLFLNATQNLLLQRPKRRDDAEWERHDDGSITLKIAASGLTRFLGARSHRLDAVSGRVWELSDGSRSVHEIGKTLFGEFGDRVDPAQDHAASVVMRLRKLQALDFLS